MTYARRRFVAGAAAGVASLIGARSVTAQSRSAADDPAERRFYDAAREMLRLAQSWGDQPYGAVLVLDRRIVGEGPSRVVQRNDPTAHAEREAVRDAQKRLGRDVIAGSILYSTSRPCRQCETAAANAGVARMVYGPDLADAGAPRA